MLSLLRLWPVLSDDNFIFESKKGEDMTGRRICIYGNSVILGTLGLNLRTYPQFELTNLVPPWPDRLHLEELKPDVIFFDLEAEHPEAAFSMLDCHPDMLIIGISPDSNLVKVWTGRQIRKISTQGLLEMINEQVNYSSTDNTERLDIKRQNQEANTLRK